MRRPLPTPGMPSPPPPPSSPPPPRPGMIPLAACLARPPAPPASSTLLLAMSLTLELSLSPTWDAALPASWPGLAFDRPLTASGASAARPAPAASPRAPDSGPDFLLGVGVGTSPTFLRASRTIWPRAFLTVSLTSLAMGLLLPGAFAFGFRYPTGSARETAWTPCSGAFRGLYATPESRETRRHAGCGALDRLVEIATRVARTLTGRSVRGLAERGAGHQPARASRARDAALGLGDADRLLEHRARIGLAAAEAQDLLQAHPRVPAQVGEVGPVGSLDGVAGQPLRLGCRAPTGEQLRLHSGRHHV